MTVLEKALELNEELTKDWVGFLSTLKSITEEKVTGTSIEYSELVEEILEDLTLVTKTKEVNITEVETLTEYLNQGYKLSKAENNYLYLTKPVKATFEDLVESLRVEIRPYRQLYLTLNRENPSLIKGVLEVSGF